MNTRVTVLAGDSYNVVVQDDAAAAAVRAQGFAEQARAFGEVYTETDAEMALIRIPDGAEIVHRLPSASGQVAPQNILTWWRRNPSPSSDPYFVTAGPDGGVRWTQTALREQDVLSTLQTAIAAVGTTGLRSFPNRAAVLTWIAANPAPPVGTVLRWPAGQVPSSDVTSIGVIYLGGTTALSSFSMPGYVPSEEVTPEHFATNTTPGTTNMNAAVQAAIDYSAAANVSGQFFRTVYGVTGIQWKQGARFKGGGNWSGVSSLFSTVGTTVFKYIGAGGANSCGFNISSLAVGTQGVATDQIQNIGLSHVTFDGSDLCEFGFYFNRSWSNNKFDFLTATGCTKHGFWAGNCWNGSPRNWHAFKNIGAGITLGINTFGWSQCAVDQSACTSFFGYYSGHNAATVPQNAWDDTTAANVEYGIGVGDCRGLTLINPQGQECSGAGFYRPAGTLSPLNVIGGYFENNGKSTGAARRWDLWYVSSTSGLNDTFDKVYFGVASTGAIKITGTPAATRRESWPLFRGIPIIGTIDADHGSYRMEDCDRDPQAIVGSKASYFGGRRSDAQNLEPIGVIVFHTTTGAITVLRKEGAITGVSYDGVGDFTLTLSTAQTNSTWVVLANSAADNRYVRAHTFTATTCKIAHKSLTNVAADPEGAANAIRLVIFPAFV